MRRVGRPELGVGDGEFEFGCRRRRCLGDLLAAVAATASTVPLPPTVNRRQPASTSGHDPQRFDVRLGHRLQPHRLPDAGGGRVHDAARVQHLLAAGLAAGSVGSKTSTTISCSPGLQGVGDVEGEIVIAAAVDAELLAVDRDLGLPIHRAEVQQHVPAAPALGDLEAAAIGHAVGVLHHARQGRLDGVRHEDLGLRAVGQLDVPQAVEVQPLLADHLRPRIFGQGLFRRDVLGPARHQRPGGRLPLGGPGGRQQQQGEQSGNHQRQALHERLLEAGSNDFLPMLTDGAATCQLGKGTLIFSNQH